MTACRSCAAEGIFVPSAKSGKNMILNAESVKGIVIEKDLEAIILGPGGAGAENAPDVARVVDVYTDHHATCPNAKDWRR